MFYGLPIHIIRDVYITASAFFKRLSSLLKYRRAIHSMNALSDASAEDLEREDTCIICREEMRLWNPQANPGAVARTRPKKLSCGHILHLGCLRSWLERQQVCPTCRRPVLPDGNGNQPAQNNPNPAGQPANPQGQQPPQHGQAPQHQQHQGAAGHPQGQAPAPPPPDNGAGGANGGGAAPGRLNHRAYNFGPFRLEFFRGDPRNPQALDAALNRAIPGRAGVADNAAPPPQQPGAPGSQILSPQFDQLVNRELASLQSLQLMQHELQTAQLLLAELSRLRQLHQQVDNPLNAGAAQSHTPSPITPTPQAASTQQIPLPQQFPPAYHSRTPPPPASSQHPHLPSFPSYPYRPPNLTRFSAPPSATAIPSGSTELPSGVVLPPGWSMLPLNRMDTNPAPTGTPPPPPPPPHTESPATAAPNEQAGPSEQRRPSPVLAPDPVPVWRGPSTFLDDAPGEPERGRRGEGEQGAEGEDAKDQGVDGKKDGEQGGEAGTEHGGSEAQGSERAGEESRDKGKGKAVSVEDAEE